MIRRPWKPKRSTWVWILAMAAVGVMGVRARARQIARADDQASSAAGANAAARRWFEDAKFGLFVHWGVYSLLGKGEWVMDNDKLPIAEYAKLPPRFNPDPVRRRGLGQAGQGGRREIHHGHQQAPRRLLHVRQPADRLRHRRRHALSQPTRSRRWPTLASKQRIKLFFYYSLLDWHHPDYFPAGKTGQTAGRRGEGDWKRYVAYYQGQVRELCTNYGEIGGIWFDGWWDQPDADWDLAGTYRMIHELQPGALVGNNHHVAPLARRGLSDVRAGPARRKRGRFQHGRRRARNCRWRPA